MRFRISYRRFRRYRQIVNILVRNGFGGLLEMLKLRRISRRRRPAAEGLPSPRAKRLRLTLEELGPTFIKVGQMLSTRADIVPADIFEELQKLQDQVPPVPPAEIIPVIESELGSSLGAIFSDFDGTPMAAASIGQVHRAQLKTGEKVAVKVQRPDIRKIIKEDIEILRTLAGLAERHLPDAEMYSPVDVVDEFARLIRRELDYTLESRNMERFARNFADDDTVYIPKVYCDLTSGRVLTMELIDGIKLSQVDELKEAGYDVEKVVVKGIQAYLKQIFIHRFFHGDPHPGNVFVLPGEVIGLMDFGIVGWLSPDIADHLNNVIIAVARRDTARITEELLHISVVDENSDIEILKTDMAEFVDRYYDISLSQFKILELVRDFGEISAKHGIRMNRQLSLLGKVLAGMEGIGRQLNPDFNILPHLEPFSKRLIAQRFSPGQVLTKAAQVAKDYTDLVAALPQDLRAILEKARDGKLRIEFRHIGLDDIVPELERSSSRLSFAMIIAALLISSAFVMRLKDLEIFGIPLPPGVIGALGYFIAAISGLWLLVTMVRNKTLR